MVADDEDMRFATSTRGMTERPATVRERASRLAERVYGCPPPRTLPPRDHNPQRLRRKFAKPKEARAHERIIRLWHLNYLGAEGGPQSAGALGVIRGMLGDRRQYYANKKEVNMIMLYEAAYLNNCEIPAGPEGHAAIMQAQERGETEVAPYFLHVPTRAEVERVRKRSHKSDAAAPALAEDD